MISVIAYHLDLPVRSGFLGVDVFIVVSGFVITGLLLREIGSSHSIRVFRFFKWRFLRLFPAHVVMLATTLLIFYLIGPYGAHKAALNQARASVAFLANGYFFARLKDYFALGDDLTLFLNTWSLSLEEQFYAIFAVVISFLVFVAKKNNQDHSGKLQNLMFWIFLILIFLSIVIGAVSSLVWRGEVRDFTISTLDPRQWTGFLFSRGVDFAFYSPVTRAWQFLIGSLLALFGFEKIRTVRAISPFLTVTALTSVLIFASVQATVFLSWSRIAATFLTAIIIIQSSTLLSSKWLVAIGDRSYSLYLWHYPFVVISRSIDSELARVAALVLTILFSELSFRHIETPFRQSNREATKYFRTPKIAPVLIVLMSVGVLFLRLDVVAKGFITRSNFLTESNDAKFFYDDATSCWSDGGNLTCGEDLNGSILLVGDSHAGSLRPGFFRAISSINLTPRFRDGRCLFAAFDRDIETVEESGCNVLGDRLQGEIISQRPRLLVFLICGRIHDTCPEGLVSESEDDWVSSGKKALQPILDAGVSIALVRDLPMLTHDPRNATSVFRSVFNLPITNFKIDRNLRNLIFGKPCQT